MVTSEEITNIFTSLGYSGCFNIYDIPGAGTKAAYDTPCGSMAFTRELNKYDACVKHLRYTTSIVVFNWTYIGEASLKLLNKSFRCFNGVPYERRTQKWEEWGEACIA